MHAAEPGEVDHAVLCPSDSYRRDACVRPVRRCVRASLSGRRARVADLDEAGIHGFDVINLFGLFAPAGTPPQGRMVVNQHINRMLEDPDILKCFTEGGIAPLKESVEVFGTRVRANHAKWGAIIKTAGIKID